jgi:16S rRNA (guanine(966)-N(2))-methyltransferase RsmD
MPRHKPKPEETDTGGKTLITAGSLRGRAVIVPQTGGVRPMLNRTRQALFNVLGQKLKGATVWDCFAGSGLLGFEALSRGAKHCTFIEKDPAHARIVQANADTLGQMRNATLIRGSVFDFVHAGVSRLPNTPAGVLFLDPPHAMLEQVPGEFWPWFAALPETPVVGPETLAVIGHPAEFEMPADIGRWQVQQTRKYGTVAFTVLIT